MITRVIGVETEYGATHRELCVESTDVTSALMAGQLVEEHEFIKNGGRFYMDLGHPEYDSPECSCPFEAALYHHAGDLFILEMRRRQGKAGREIEIFRDNIDPEGSSYGMHENYLVARRGLDEQQCDASLVPFLATRYILFGNGHIGQDKRFYLSQRAGVLDRTIGHGYAIAGDRSLINHRSDWYLPWHLTGRYRRLHLTGADTNVSQRATAVRLGATSLVLSLLEDGASFEHLNFTHPIPVIRHLNQDLRLKTPYPCVDGCWRSALDIQQEYCDRAYKLLCGYYGADNDVPAWCFEVHALWQRALDDLKKTEPSELTPKTVWIDWKVKNFLLEIWNLNRRRTTALEQFSLLLEYHNIDPAKSLAWYLISQREFPGCLFDLETLRQAAFAPPSFERAKERARWVEDEQFLRVPDFSIGWVGAKVGKEFHTFAFPVLELDRMAQVV